MDLNYGFKEEKKMLFNQNIPSWCILLWNFKNPCFIKTIENDFTRNKINQFEIIFPGHVGNTFASQDQSDLFFEGMVEAEDLTAADAEIEDIAMIFEIQNE